MSKKVSVTVTVGEGSELHNHDIGYRQTLEHVHGGADDVIELIPYRPYREQINEMMKPYIDEYNAKQQERYAAAWERYNKGEIKTKPRKRDYQPMGYDYFEDHKDDVYYNRATKDKETVQMFRSLILGLGDKADRDNGVITRDEAEGVMRGVVKRWPELFPDFKLLGATLHTDEEGFYHCHIDYKPMFEGETRERGLGVLVGQEAALEHMGFQPEQSLINASDKAPIRFNAFRNLLYLETEKELNKRNLRLLWGATKIKEPDKDASTNQALGHWQETRDAANDMQQVINAALDVQAGEIDANNSVYFMEQWLPKAEQVIKRVARSPRTIDRRGYKVTFNLFDQLKSLLDRFLSFIGNIIGYMCELEAENAALRKEVKELQPMARDGLEKTREIARLKSELKTIQKKLAIIENNPYLNQLLENEYRSKTKNKEQ